MTTLRAIAAVLCISSAASAQQPQFTTYRVVAGDTCGSIARRVYGNSRRYDLIHQHNPSLGPMPHSLQAGTTLQLPRVEASPGPDATVTAVQRDVRSQPPRDTDWGNARIGQELSQGWRVNTQDRSTAELTFRNSSVATVREQTLVIVYGAGMREERREGARAVVRQGALFSRLNALSGGEPLEVETPSAQATLRDGESSVHVDADGTTRVAVHRGRAATVRRASGESPVEVPPGMGTKIQRGRAPTAPRPLPSAPRWQAQGIRTFVSIGEHGGTIRGAWSPSPDAVRYRVELSRREDGRDLVLATEVPGTVREFEVHRLPVGRYFARVAAIDADGLEGRSADALELAVLQARLVAPGQSLDPPPMPGDLDLDHLDSGLADLDLAAMANVPAEALQHSRLALPPGVACALDASPPSDVVILDTPGEHTLRCQAPEGEVAQAIVRVTTVAARVYRDAEDEPAELAREGETAVRIAIDGAPSADLSVVTDPGITVVSVAPHPRGGLRAVLRVESAEGHEAILRIVAGGSALATVPVPIRAAPPPIAAPARLPAVHEAFGSSAFASWVGLRDERRRGSGMHLAVAAMSAADGDVDARLRVTAGLRASLLEERLRFDLAVPLDAIGSVNRTSQRGSRDLFAAVSSLFFEDAELGVGVAGEVGVWIPTAAAQGLDRARMQIAVDASLRLLDDLLTLRTRQAAIFDLIERGGALWASAYGADLRIIGPLSAGLEIALSIGHEDARDWIATGIGGAVALDLAPIVLSLGGRVGLSDDPLLGRGLVTLSARGTFDP